MKRFFVSQILGNDFELTGSEHHHLAFVMRAKPGDKIILCNGDNCDYKYTIVKITRDEATLAFDSKSKNKQNPKNKLVVFIGLIKLDNLALIVEKLNELGASELVPFTSSNSNIAAKNVNIEKLNSIAKQSCKQCGRSIPLKVHEPITFKEMLNEITSFDNTFYADRGEKQDRITREKTQGSSYNALVIGPEGGFTLEENLVITEVATPITLGSRTLRSETAAIAATTLILSKMGEI
ncbi:MAG: 16S rRNA (uracil(1498)-N(3))-methyltransferase [Firmicutes bacterium]|nr:16S rRNA (uracil(1498)-N(3))-methyltransferase [Bacillota bacterium]